MNSLPKQIKGVITGDIIKSRKINSSARITTLKIIENLKDELSHLGLAKIELYRGDGFQILVNNPINVLRIAILLRAKLIGYTKEMVGLKSDARVGIGIGTINYEDENIMLSDGEAFLNSGQQLDFLDKNSQMAINTSWDEVNKEFNISTKFADDVISGWSDKQARIAYLLLSQNLTQKEVAEKLDSTTQNVNKLAIAAKESLIKLYIERFEQKINEKI